MEEQDCAVASGGPSGKTASTSLHPGSLIVLIGQGNNIRVRMTKTQAMVTGLITAAMLPAAYLAIAFPLSPDSWSAIVGSFFVFLYFSTAATLVLALPLLLLLRKRGLIAWWSALIAGGLVGAVALFCATSLQSANIQTTTQYVVLGAISGLSFWAIWRLGRP